MIVSRVESDRVFGEHGAAAEQGNMIREVNAQGLLPKGTTSLHVIVRSDEAALEQARAGSARSSGLTPNAETASLPQSPRLS